MRIEEGQLNELVLDPELELINCEYYLEIRDIFRLIIGKLDIKSMSVYVISPEPDNDLFLFSSHFSIEHRLIQSGQWMYDPLLHPKNFKNNSLLDWRSLYANEGADCVFAEKTLSYKNSFGLSLVRKTNDFHLIYSYLLGCSEIEFEKIKRSRLDIYLKMGDHLFKQLQPIWRRHHTGPTLPDIQYHAPYRPGPPKDVKTQARHNFKPLLVSSRKPRSHI